MEIGTIPVTAKKKKKKEIINGIKERQSVLWNDNIMTT